MKYLILAGGMGTRLWPVSRKNFAKQFFQVVDQFTMLQNTALRVSADKGKDIYVISNSASIPVIIRQLRDVLPDFNETHIIHEPIGRNTAPAISYSTGFFKPDDVITVLSSDHHIGDPAGFQNALLEAGKIAASGYIVTLGITPDSPKTGYGYIEKNDEKILNGYKVKRFIEKPSLEKAQTYLKSGRFFWNAGIFIFQVAIFLEELKKHCPDLYNINEELHHKHTNNQPVTIEDFNRFPKISIDYALMEKTGRMVVVPGSFRWSDVGSFKSIYELSPKDDEHNVIKCPNDNVIKIDCHNLFVMGGQRKIALINLKSLAIVDMPDALLISDLESTELVKQVVDELSHKKALESEQPPNIKTEWGNFETVQTESDNNLGFLTILSAKKIYYNKKSDLIEYWFILSGLIEIVYNDQKVNYDNPGVIKLETPGQYCIYNPSNQNVLKMMIRFSTISEAAALFQLIGTQEC